MLKDDSYSSVSFGIVKGKFKMWLLNELENKCNSNKIAIIHRNENITFKELWDKSEKLAFFINENCNTKSPIVIYGNKDIDITVIMIASMKTGRAYIPVDITFPRERLLKIASMVDSEIIFNFSDRDISGQYNIIDKKSLQSTIYTKELKEFNKSFWVKPEDNCYILFTSGSTGVPKGVQITRKNIENFVSWFSKDCVVDENKQFVLNQVSYSFDVSVISLYIYLAMGKTLFNIDKEMIDNTRTLFDYLKISDISVWISTPAFLEICSFDDSFNSDMLPKLKKFILAGEVLTKKLVRIIHNKFENSIVINGYGPTEGTVLLSACEITEDMLNDEKSLPIGYILPNSIHCIIDENGKNVQNSGEIGELVVISNSISNGYYKNTEQTNKVFFKSEDGRMGYKTGDLAYETNGLLYYIARKDFQIKLNGYRIELDDISNNLNKIGFINNNVVLPVYKDERVSYIVAFVTLNDRPEVSNIKIGIIIKNELKNLIPSYMVPRKIVILDRFPLNTNGKIDRKKLMEEI